MKEFHEAANEFERSYTGEHCDKEHWDDDDLNHAFVMGCIYADFEIKNSKMSAGLISEKSFLEVKDLADRMACFIKNRMGFLKGDSLKDADEFIDQWFNKNGDRD